MRVAVTGATGNVGTSLTPLLAADPEIDEVVGIARRLPGLSVDGVRWVAADVSSDDLAPHLAGVDAVVHLAWAIQPSHDMSRLRSVNVEGSRRTFQAALEAGVPTIIHASSVGAYSPSPGQRRVDESHPVEGVPSSFYSRHKAEVERMLAGLQEEHPQVRVVQMRPALIFKRSAATRIRRLFIGPLFPGSLLRLAIPIVPFPAGVRFQAVHTEDVADGYRRALLSEVKGPVNLAAEPVVEGREVAQLLRGRAMGMSSSVARSILEVGWRLRLHPTSTGWLDMGRLSPLLDAGRARRELGWEPQGSSVEALSELLEGLRHSGDYPTPPMSKATGGPLRSRELMTGIGGTGGPG